MGGFDRGMGGFDRGGLGGQMGGFDRAGSDGFRGASASGYRGLPGGREGAAGLDRGLEGRTGAASRGELNRFLGLPTDAGMSALGGAAARGGMLAAGSIGAAGAFRAVTPAAARSQGWAVRRDFPGYGWYGRDWYGRFPGAWWPAAWYRPGLGAWAWCTWPMLGGWFGYSGVSPMFYNYGSNFLYNGGDVYYNGQSIASASDYYDQVSGLAAGAAPPDADASDWLPLGVFTLVENGQAQPSLVFQLAVNKAGTLRGNCSKPDEQFVGAVSGAVDKDKQRVAWTVGDDTQTVYETGLYNLTRDETPALIHRGADKTEQWLLVRMKQPNSSGATKDQ